MVEIALRWMSWTLTDHKSTSVQIITWNNVHRGVCRHMTPLGHSDWKLGAHTIYELHFWKRPEPYRSVDRFTLQSRHNERNGVPNHQPHDSLLDLLFGRRSKKTSKIRVTAFCKGNSPVTGVWTSNAENVSIWWLHHDQFMNIAQWKLVPD